MVFIWDLTPVEMLGNSAIQQQWGEWSTVYICEKNVVESYKSIKSTKAEYILFPLLNTECVLSGPAV